MKTRSKKGTKEKQKMNLTRVWGKWEERWRNHEKLKKKGFKLQERKRRKKER